MQKTQKPSLHSLKKAPFATCDDSITTVLLAVSLSAEDPEGPNATGDDANVAVTTPDDNLNAILPWDGELAGNDG